MQANHILCNDVCFLVLEEGTFLDPRKKCSNRSNSAMVRLVHVSGYSDRSHLADPGIIYLFSQNNYWPSYGQSKLSLVWALQISLDILREMTPFCYFFPCYTSPTATKNNKMVLLISPFQWCVEKIFLTCNFSVENSICAFVPVLHTTAAMGIWELNFLRDILRRNIPVNEENRWIS